MRKETKKYLIKRAREDAYNYFDMLYVPHTPTVRLNREFIDSLDSNQVIALVMLQDSLKI